MKNLTILLVIFPIWLNAQNISVASFKLLERDLEARVVSPKKDQNGEKCAIIKIVTTEQGFVFEGDMNGIVTTQYKTGEYWVYLPWGSKKITIKHAQLGVLRNYIYPIPIKEATVYEMVLTTGKVTTIVEDYEVPTQWVVITSHPSGASIFINDVNKGLTPFQQEMAEGEYTYRIEYPMYHNEVGILNLVAAEGKKAMDIKLKPNFGNIHVTSQPETGATVFLDEQPTGKTTPCTLEKIKSGQHTIRLQREWYQPISKRVTANDTQTVELPVTMLPNFGDVKITDQNKAGIYIDGTYKANGYWEGRLIAGFHTFEAKKDKYHPDKSKIEITAGEVKELSLYTQPMLGKVKIITNPFEATIKIAGKEMGKTPITIDKLLIGSYTVELSKLGFTTISKTIEIKENEIFEIKTDLHKGADISFTTQPKGVTIIIDDKKMGTTPCKIALEQGKYKIKYEKNNYNTIEKNITIDRYTKIQSETLTGKMVTATINSTPKGAKIYLAQRLKGKTNFTFPITAGEYKLKIIRKGFKPYEKDFDFSEKQKIDLNLEPAQHRSKGLAILYSALMPGVGQTYLNRGGAAWLTGIATYGLLGAAIMQNNAAVDAYENYKTEGGASKKNDYLTDAETKYNQSQILLYTAAGTWLANMVWVALMPPDNKRFKNIKPMVGYNPNNKILNYGITMRIRN